MTTHSDIRLTSAEIATLWTAYQNDTLSVCMLEYFINNNDDPDLDVLLQFSKKISEENVKFLTETFTKENFPVPDGFSKEKDVVPNAPRIYEDTFYLTFMRQMAKVGMVTFSAALSLAVRKDIIKFYKKNLHLISNLYEKTTELSTQKGLIVRAPYIAYPEKVEYVKGKEYLTGSLNPLTHRRPLNAIEISHLFMNTETNLIGSMLALSFSQMAQTKEVTEYMFRAHEISEKHVKIFSEKLISSDVKAPMASDTTITNSTAPAFSEKLMMFVMTLMSDAGMANYGLAASSSMRADLSSDYARLLLEVGGFVKSGADIMIKNGWLEEPPQSSNREELSNHNQKMP